mgnify:CR=1 FL=1
MQGKLSPEDIRLKLRRAHGSGVGQYVADVGDAGEVHDHALKAQAESGVAAGIFCNIWKPRYSR